MDVTSRGDTSIHVFCLHHRSASNETPSYASLTAVTASSNVATSDDIDDVYAEMTGVVEFDENSIVEHSFQFNDAELTNLSNNSADDSGISDSAMSSPSLSNMSDFNSTTSSIGSSASSIRKPKIKMPSSGFGVSQECQKCSKLIEPRNQIFRWQCSLCEYKAHLKHNVTTHIKFKHARGNAMPKENKSIELAIELTRVLAECFGKTKTQIALQAVSGQKNVDDLSFLADSIVSNTSGTTHISGIHLDEPIDKTIGAIGEQTISSRVVSAVLNSTTYKCKMCRRIVSKHKTYGHATTHAARKRYRCGDCGAQHQCKFNLKTHIKSQHDNNANIIDEMCDEMEQEFDKCYQECFPNLEKAQVPKPPTQPNATKPTTRKRKRNIL